MKNSWGKSYGDQGYIKIKRGTCGIGRWSCIAVSCSRVGDGAPDEIPEEIPKPPPSNACDVRHIFGEISGKKKTVYKMSNGMYVLNFCKINLT